MQDKIIKLITLRYGRELEDYYPSVKEAAIEACYCIDNNSALPINILSDEEIMWKNDLSDNCYDSLYMIAGIED